MKAILKTFDFFAEINWNFYSFLVENLLQVSHKNTTS